MSSSYLEITLREYYKPFPPPCAEGFEAIDKIAKWLEGRGIDSQGGGVIAVAHATNGHIYFGFSAALQAACKHLLTNIRDAHPDIQTYCTDIGKVLAKEFKRQNPGCAEKKVVYGVRRGGTTFRNLTVGAYREWEINKRLTAHVPIGDQSRAYVAPCASCRHAYTVAGF